MSIFDLRDRVIEEYSEYVSSFLTIEDQRLRDFISKELIEKGALWPPALLQLNPSYKKASTVEELVARGKLHTACADIFRDNLGETLTLFRHQQEAIETALGGRGFVVTSGTGSGKSMTYFIPIMDAILKAGPSQPKVWAIIVYPMNALVNSQHQALEELASAYREKTGTDFPIRFNKYTGQDIENRQKIQENPPHILLTNYVMLELMMIRPEEYVFVDRATTNLRYLVIDELHTYRGRQGADVAMLIRRLKERSGNPDLTCIGTSATMISGKAATPQERRAAVAAFASQIFGTAFAPDQVIEETLERATAHGITIETVDLREAITKPLPANPVEFLSHPLAVWAEAEFGLEEEEGGNLRRRAPISLKEGAERLAERVGLDFDICREALHRLFLAGAALKVNENEPLFSFKLHQFIAQGNRAFASLEDRGRRLFDLEGHAFKERDGQLMTMFTLKFCRTCGMDYYEVMLNGEDGRFHPISDEFRGSEEGEGFGYLYIPQEGTEVEWGPETLPSEWLTESGRVKKSFREHVPRPFWVWPDGSLSDVPAEGAVKAWFQPRPFRLCLNCGVFYTGKDGEFAKLSGLSSEGRSTSTTVLALSSLMNAPSAGIEAGARKILSFTDNRQDASLQSGHFNDFVQVSLLRSAIYDAVAKAGELRSHEIAGRVVESMKLPFSAYAANKQIKEDSTQGKEITRTFTDITEYRIYEDLRRGWRVVQPNLEQCGLLRMEYIDLEKTCREEEHWEGIKQLADAGPEKRYEILTAILDHFRRQLAINAACLDETRQQQLRKRSEDTIDPRWGFEEQERLRQGTRFLLPGQEGWLPGSFSLGRRSLIHRYLKRTVPAFDPDYESNMEKLMDLLCSFGLLRRGSERGITFVQLEPSAMIWKLGDGTPASEPLYQRRADDPVYREAEREANRYFREFYMRSAELLHEIEGREHTAQISYQNREERERRFRSGELKCLFCSPTMELGIDIADLQLVHMRNVPPTPANYAQRSGRAGRKGDPALVLTYCHAGSGHDQYFFLHRREMVSGAVRPPRIDLTSEDLARSHLHSIWLAEVGLSLGHSLTDLVDLRVEGYPLTEDVRKKIMLSEKRFGECLQRARKVFASCSTDLEDAAWYSEEWLERTLRRAPEEFDAAFNRFRELYHAADRQWVEANEILRFKRGNREEEKNAERARTEAERQKDLLANTTSSREESGRRGIPSRLQFPPPAPERFPATSGRQRLSHPPALSGHLRVRAEQLHLPRGLQVSGMATGHFPHRPGQEDERGEALQRLRIPARRRGPGCLFQLRNPPDRRQLHLRYPARSDQRGHPPAGAHHQRGRGAEALGLPHHHTFRVCAGAG